MEKDLYNAHKVQKNVPRIVGLEPLTLSRITSLKKILSFGCLGHLTQVLKHHILIFPREGIFHSLTFFYFRPRGQSRAAEPDCPR